MNKSENGASAIAQFGGIFFKVESENERMITIYAAYQKICKYWQNTSCDMITHSSEF